MATQNAPGSSYIFFSLALELALLQGTLVPYNGEWYLETKMWVLGMLVAMGV